MSFSSIAARKPHPHAEVIKAWADGAQVQFQYYATKEWGDDNSPQFHAERQYRVKPEKVYPETRLGDGEICSAYYGGGPVKGPDEETKAWYRVANAALRHAIDSDQVITALDHNNALAALDRRLNATRAARDMAVAEAVEKAFLAMVAKYSTGCAQFASQGVILPLIIAGVHP